MVAFGGEYSNANLGQFFVRPPMRHLQMGSLQVTEQDLRKIVNSKNPTDKEWIKGVGALIFSGIVDEKIITEHYLEKAQPIRTSHFRDRFLEDFKQSLKTENPESVYKRVVGQFHVNKENDKECLDARARGEKCNWKLDFQYCDWYKPLADFSKPINGDEIKEFNHWMDKELILAMHGSSILSLTSSLYSQLVNFKKHNKKPEKGITPIETTYRCIGKVNVKWDDTQESIKEKIIELEKKLAYTQRFSKTRFGVFRAIPVANEISSDPWDEFTLYIVEDQIPPSFHSFLNYVSNELDGMYLARGRKLIIGRMLGAQLGGLEDYPQLMWKQKIISSEKSITKSAHFKILKLTANNKKILDAFINNELELLLYKKISLNQSNTTDLLNDWIREVELKYPDVLIKKSGGQDFSSTFSKIFKPYVANSQQEAAFYQDLFRRELRDLESDSEISPSYTVRYLNAEKTEGELIVMVQESEPLVQAVELFDSRVDTKRLALKASSIKKTNAFDRLFRKALSHFQFDLSRLSQMVPELKGLSQQELLNQIFSVVLNPEQTENELNQFLNQTYFSPLRPGKTVFNGK